ncbi:MAG: hypothetical protein K8L97_13150 [Anaerolineae bacterium]|nr:hypothetical protein [Anaerolineae bacterium]
MKDYKELDLQQLEWIQKGGFSQNYELRDEDGEVVAQLNRPHWYSRYAEVDAPGHRWGFEPKGFFRRKIIVKSLGTDEEIAVFNYGLSNGTLNFADGRVYHWRQSNFWGTKWAWTTDDGEPIVGFESKGLLRYRGEMSLSPASDEISHITLLVFLGWYLVTLHYEDSAASTVVVTG